jgi:CubicO group peptidase (beta-lactamase class C family)
VNKLLVVAVLVLGSHAAMNAQSGVTGRWIGVLISPQGVTRELDFDLNASAGAVSGTVSGRPISGGRVDANGVAFTIINPTDPAQSTSFVGEIDRDEILFRVTGLAPIPMRFVARRDVRRAVSGSVTDRVFVEQLLKQANVPGVSIAVIQDFKIAATLAYGIADVATGAPVTAETLFQAGSISKPVAAMASLKAVQERRFTLDQNINAILRSWKLPDGPFTAAQPVTPRTLMSHTSGIEGGFGTPGFSPGAALPTLIEILNGLPPSNTATRVERPPFTRFKYSNGGVLVQQLALMDVTGKPFEQIVGEWVFRPLGMSHSTFELALSPARASIAARGHAPNGARMETPWRVYPGQAAGGLWTTPTDLATFAIDIQRSLLGKSDRVLSQAMAREMVTPVGIGPYGLGFEVVGQGEGWYFRHGGDNEGFQSELMAHRVKGYGVVIMTNGANGVALIQQLRRLIQQEYGWDVFEAAR